MGASLSRREASPDEPGATAPLRGDDDEALRGDESASAPEASAALKRPRSCSKAEVCFTRVLEDGHNVTAILAFAGYRNVLRLEELCPRAWRIVRGAHIELDVSKEKAIIVAVKTAARGELFQARREGVFDIHTHFCFSFNACGRSASDVIYRDDLALMPSPRPRAPALVQGSRGADVDAARNACAIAAAERRRAALLSMGCFNVELGDRAVAQRNADQAALTSLKARLTENLSEVETQRAAAVAPAGAKKLVEAMGGELMTPRRVVLAARRQGLRPSTQFYGTQAQLAKAMKDSARASAVLDEASMRHLVVHFWKAMSHHLFLGLPEEVFLQEVCGPAGLSTAAHAVLQEVQSGVLLPIVGVFKAKGLEHSSQFDNRVGDVRVDDVARIACHEYLWPAFFGFGIASLARDAATCFSAEAPFLDHLGCFTDRTSSTFESLVIRQYGDVFHGANGPYSVVLAVLDALATPRDGEASEVGKQRVSQAVQSLLTKERVHALAPGDPIDYAEGDPTPPRAEITWARGEIVRLVEDKVVVKVDDAEIETMSGHLRLVEEQPSAAAILLAYAISDNRNAIVREILAYMQHPLSYVVGEPGKSISTRSDARCTALDHAIIAKNPVAIGLLWASYDNVRRSADKPRGWDAVRATCHSLEKAMAANTTPTERADLLCALRSSPGVFVQHRNIWRNIEGWSREFIAIKTAPMDLAVLAAIDGDVVGVRSFITSHAPTQALPSKSLQLLSKPIRMLSALWRSTDAEETTDPSAKATRWRIQMQVLLTLACKSGRDEVVAEVMRSSVGIFVDEAARIAIAEGHLRCLELLLSNGSLEGFLSKFATDAPIGRQYEAFRVILEAIRVGSGGAIDILRCHGVPLDGEIGGASYLEYACREGQPDAVRALLRDENICASVRERRSDALSMAAIGGFAGTLEVLFETFSLAHVIEGSDPVLVSAVLSDDLATVKVVLEQPDVDLEAALPGHKNALKVAAFKLNYDIVALLLARGAMTRTTHFGPTSFNDPLQYALNADTEDICRADPIVRLVLRERPHDFTSNFLNYIKLHWMHEYSIEEFLDQGADVNQKDEIGITPLHVVVYYTTTRTGDGIQRFRLVQCLSTLILRGADMNAKTSKDATRENSLLPLAEGVSLDAGMTPLTIAAAAKVRNPRCEMVAFMNLWLRHRSQGVKTFPESARLLEAEMAEAKAKNK